MNDRLNTLFASVNARLFAPEEGQAITEYALVLAFVAVALGVLLTGLGSAIGDKFTAVAKDITG